MPKVYEKREKATKHKVNDHLVKANTLAKIAALYQTKAAEGYEFADWKPLALYNWGTTEPAEVNRALMETIGCSTLDTADPGNTVLLPDDELPGEILVPKIWKKEGLALKKRHTIKIRRRAPATAVRIEKLDPWFIPGVDNERCVIQYKLEGLADRAHTARMDIYGSNYCECTEWKNGLGKYDDPAKLADEPLYTHSEVKREERVGDELKWAGDVTTTKGMLGRKTGKAKKRHVNVAFSPYTVHFRYWKAEGDKKARLLLEPFWPHWEEKEEKPAVTEDFASSPAKFKWTNAEEQDYGTIEVTDATQQRVHLAVLKKEELEKKAQEVTWNKAYREDVLNGEFKPAFIDDQAEPTPLKRLLFKSTPYKATVRTVQTKPKADTFKIKWEIKETTKLERGLFEIVDKDNKVVFRKGLVKAKVGQAKHEFAWDGKYLKGLKNSRAKDSDPQDKVYEAIPEDMPYRVQIQVHTGEDQPEGLAMAAMHTEVRLFAHKENYRPKDIRFDSWTAKPSLALAKGPLVPGDDPPLGQRAKWFRHKLAQFGFHPGPVTDKPASDAEFKIALREFKRSVPADAQAGAGNFKRLNLDNAEADATNLATETAINKITDRYKRKWFGDLGRVLGNNEDPDLNDDTVKTRLPDPAADLIVWVDDRQYYTKYASKDENGNPYLSGTVDARAFGLNDYRGDMGIGDTRTDTDATAVSRPWIPLQVDLPLLSRSDSLAVEHSADKVLIADEAAKNAMRRAIGPLRVDWSFDELPPDVSTISPANYPDAAQVRTRKYVAWALRNKKGEHTRKDTERKAVYTNCPVDLGGIRPTSLATYYQEAFGLGDLSLEPWRATADSETESVATVVHDHIAAAQKDKTDLFEPLIGTAGAYFHPSRIAGDGYRVRAEVRFKKFTDYEFPNLEVLERRYPAPPHAHSARLRVWRRASMRGYACWADPNPGNWPGLLAGVRMMYRTGHVYLVHEGGAPTTFPLNTVFDETKVADQNRYKGIVHHNTANAWHKEKSRIRLRKEDIWPWGHRDDLGWTRKSALNADVDNINNVFIEAITDATWREFRDGLLLAMVRQAEKDGHFRGHLFVQFKASPAAKVVKYECTGATKHVYWYLEKKPSGASLLRKDGEACASGGCAGTLNAKSSISFDQGLPFPAVGIALGAAWLFADGARSDTWAHEAGHHRHLEHSASAPGDKPAQHDSENNSSQNWVTLGETVAKKQHWDRRCLMSYTKDKDRYPCGKCALRNRGWKVQSLGHPGPDVTEA